MKHRTEVLLLMGSRFEITPYAETDSLVEAGITAAIAETQRIEAFLSEWIPESAVSEINRNAGLKPVKITDELFGIIARSKKVSELTDGAFDISWAAARNVWKFDGSMTEFPEAHVTDSLKKLINYKNIELNEADKTVFLKEKGMAIGFGAIGKGYAANRCKIVMQQLGIQNGIVIAGGDLTAWGKPEGKAYWSIGIADPLNPEKARAWFNTPSGAVVTSGNYEHFTMFNGIHYAHIINPVTALPVENKLRSVTIVCPDAELADALATSVYVLGISNGLALINQLKGVECVIIDGEMRFHTSAGLNIEYPMTTKLDNRTIFTIKN